MSFRNNLQHLRATRGMTQEQLAMLLGVSRQSVTKWEAERAYPEMDKLLKLCQVFECTLDDLVQGDLTARPVAAADPSVPHAAQDIFGYDEHMRRFAWRVPTGVAIVILSIALGALFEGWTPVAGGDPDAVFLGIVFVGVLAALALFVPAGMEHSAFAKEHPYIEDFYTVEQKTRARKQLSYGVLGGAAAVFVGLVAMLFTEGTAFEERGVSALLACVAVGAWLMVHFGMMYGRTNVAEYNKSVVDDLEIEDIVNARIDEARREALLRAKRESSRVGAVCGVIMIAATIVGLLLLFGPLFGGQNVDDIDWAAGSATYFWLAWPVGGMLCGIAVLLMKAFGKK